MDPLNLGSKLYDACFNQDWGTVISYLQNHKAPANYKHPKNQMSILYVAVARNAPLPVIKELIDRGAHPQDADMKGFTPLHASCEFRVPVETVLYLLKNGADPNQQAHDGATALHFATQFVASREIVLALLQAGAQVNIHKKNGGTPLFAAVENGAPLEIVLLLLEAGADDQVSITNYRTSQIETPLSLARKKCTPEVIELLEDWGKNRYNPSTRATDKPSSSTSITSTSRLNGGNHALSNGHSKDLSASDAAEKARLLFRHAVNSSSLLRVTRTQMPNEEQKLHHGLIEVTKGDQVELVMGSLEEGLFEPYHQYVLVSAKDGSTGKVLISALVDPASPATIDDQ